MRTIRALSSFTIFLIVLASFKVSADSLNLVNGDRISGQVLSASTDAVVLESDMLGKISVPRSRIASISLNSAASAPATAGRTELSASVSMKTNLDLSAAFKNLGADAEAVRQIREQLLGGANPEAKQKYDELVGGLLSGRLNMSDLRKEAISSANQLRALKKDLGPEGDSLDAYLEILDNFLKQSSDSETVPGSAPRSSGKP